MEILDESFAELSRGDSIPKRNDATNPAFDRNAAGLVAYCGLWFAAVLAPSGYLASTIVTVVIMILFVAILGACLSHHRDAWLGFAVFGWGYTLLALGPWPNNDLKAHLLPSVGIVDAFVQLFGGVDRPGTGRSVYVEAGQNSMIKYQVGPPTPVPPRFEAVARRGPTLIVSQRDGMQFALSGEPDFYAFEWSAHALFSLLFGGIGSIVASWFHSRRGRSSDEPSVGTA